MKFWLEEALETVKSPSSGIEVVDSVRSHVFKFLLKLDTYLGRKAIPVPYIGVSYNGHMVLGWVGSSCRLDLEFYEGRSM